MLDSSNAAGICSIFAVVLCVLVVSSTCIAAPFDSWIPPILDKSYKPPAPTAVTLSAVTGKVFKERLLQVDINGLQLNQTVLVLEDKVGVLYVWGHDLQRWNFRPPDASLAIDYQGEKFYPLSAVSNVSQIIDPTTLTLKIEVRPGAFTETTLSSRSETIPLPVKPSPGGFINYDLLFAHSDNSIQRSGQFELGYFNRFGVGTSNVFADNSGSNSGMKRLDTTWTADFPEKLQTVHLGDAINVTGSWGRSLRFGGIQFGTNFDTQPGFVTFPPQRAAGQAELPSTVDVFINNALVTSQSVPPGPFSIGNLPVITGAGEVQLVVRDIFGREQLVTQPFYASQSLLKPGLDNYSLELGFVRENFGINSNDYGKGMGSLTYRRGLSERFTGEVHGEGLQGQTTVGIGGDYLILQLATVSAFIAGSRSDLGNGGMLLLGVDRLAQPWSLGARTQWTSSSFSQIGLQAPQLAPAQLSSLNLSYSANTGGSVGIAYVSQHSRGQSDLRIATLSYSISVKNIGSLTFSGVRNFSVDANTSIFAMLSISLSPSTSVSGSAQSQRGGVSKNSDEITTTLQRNLPPGEGYGYRVKARTGGDLEGSYLLQNNLGTYTLEAARVQGFDSSRLGISGGVALFTDDFFMSRRIDQSFAVVNVADYQHVRILADNQPAGRTNTSGNALIPRLRAYDKNVISIDQRDLPMDAEIPTLKFDAVPYFRSGIEIKFPIKHSRGATFTLHFEDGTPLPVGTSVQEIGKDEIFTVGYDGEVYVVGLDPITRFRATWNNLGCEFEVLFTVSANPLPDLGIFICKGVKPS